MLDVKTRLRRLRRPRILIEAARKGCPDFDRDRYLRRLIGLPVPPRSAEAVMILLDLEADQNALRKAADASYRPLRHLEVMIALLSEADALSA